MISIAKDVCVILPCHSWSQYLPEALASIDAQLVRPEHTIVVLDAPEDFDLETYHLILDSHSCIQVWLTENVGPAAARNEGMEWAHAIGSEWVVFLDEDDLLHPQYLQRMLHSRELCPWASIHYCDWVKFGDWAGYQRTPEYSYERLLAGPFMTSASLISVQTWLDVKEKNGTGFDPELRGWEDWCFFMEAGALGHHGARVGLGLLRYRKHSDRSISDGAHSRLPEIVQYVRAKMLSQYDVEVTYQIPGS